MLKVTLDFGGKEIYINEHTIRSIESRGGDVMDGACIWIEGDDAALIVRDPVQTIIGRLASSDNTYNSRTEFQLELYQRDISHAKRHREINQHQMDWLMGAAIVSAAAQVIIGGLLLVFVHFVQNVNFR